LSKISNNQILQFNEFIVNHLLIKTISDMHGKERFPSKDTDFLLAVSIIINYLNVATNKTRLVITPAAVAGLTQATALLASFNTALTLSQTPATANALSITSKNTYRTQLEGALRIVYTDFQPSILTPLDRETLNIPLPVTTRTNAQVPEFFPDIELVSQTHMAVTFNLKDPSNSSSMAMPDTIAYVELQYAIELKDENGHTIPVSPKDYRAMGISSKLRFIFKYLDDSIGDTILVRARYVNTRNQAGPWSHILKITLV
jgi:hypothetical protein